MIKFKSPVDIIAHYDDFIKEENNSNRKERYEERTLNSQKKIETSKK